MINETEMEVEDYEEVIGDLGYTVTLLALRQDKTRAHSEVFGTTPQPIFLRFGKSNLSAIYTKWCAQTFPQIFFTFRTF